MIAGLSVGMECTAIPVLVISAALGASYWCGQKGMLAVFNGDWGVMKAAMSPAAAGLYGTPSRRGHVSTAAYILSMDTFGDHRKRGASSNEPAAKKTHKTNGSTRSATRQGPDKGYAVGSAALAAFLSSRPTSTKSTLPAHGYDAAVKAGQKAELVQLKDTGIDLGHVPVFIGGLIGAGLVFLFSALVIRAVGKAAQTVIVEVRRQFREDPGIMAGTSKPDYARAVDIVTIGALKAMTLPGLLPVLIPVAVGVGIRLLGVKAGTAPQSVAALLMVGTIVGIMMALFMNNGGGAGQRQAIIENGAHGGKGSDAHKARSSATRSAIRSRFGRPSLHVPSRSRR